MATGDQMKHTVTLDKLTYSSGLKKLLEYCKHTTQQNNKSLGVFRHFNEVVDDGRSFLFHQMYG